METKTRWNRTDHGLIVPASYQADRPTCAVTGLTLPDRPRRYGDQTSLGLFCGAGGMSLGLCQAGFHEVAAAEWDIAAAATYLFNLGHPDCEVHFLEDADRKRYENQGRVKHPIRFEPGGNVHRPDWLNSEEEGCRHFYFGDCRKLTGDRVLADLGMERTEIDVVAGGHPCQGLSTANSKRCIEDPRNGLLWEFCRIVEEVRPKAFILENVPPLLSAARGALFRLLCTRMNEAGYDVTADILDAVNYGVPQYRRRALVVGTLAALAGRTRFQFPIPSHWGITAPAGGEFKTTNGFFAHYNLGDVDSEEDEVEYDEQAGSFRGGDIRSGGTPRVRPEEPVAQLGLDSLYEDE